MAANLPKHNKIEAPAQAAGYIFQFRFGLLRAVELIKEDPTASIGLEKIDDIYVSSSTGANWLGQIKHASNASVSFSDYSAPIWRTIGNWARLIAAAAIKIEDTKFLIWTNAQLEEGSAVAALAEEPSEERSMRALALLQDAAKQSGNSATAKDRHDFLSLSPLHQRSLIAAVQVVSASGLADVTVELQKALHFCCEAAQLPDLVAELEGWWIDRISPELGQGKGPIIKLLEVDAVISRLREKYKLSSLSFDDELPEGDPASLDGYMFVSQIRVLKSQEGRIRNAQRNFLRARAQRSSWIREAKIDPAEIAKYDDELADLWRTKFEIMSDEIVSDTTDWEREGAGRKLLAWAETRQVPLRGAQAGFLTSGSFHCLADEVRIGWHPQYLGMFGGALDG